MLSAFIIAFGLIAGVFVGYRAYQESSRNKRISEEIRLLRADADRVEQENRKLRDRIEYLQSDSFREQEAKRVLEYQKSGEKVVFVRERAYDSNAGRFEESSDRNENDFFSSDDRAESQIPNWKKWWEKFF